MAGARRPTPRPAAPAGFTLETAFLVERSPHAYPESCVAWPAGRATGAMCAAPARWTLCLRTQLLGLLATVPLCESHAREVPVDPVDRVPYLKSLVCHVCRAPATRTSACGVCHRQGEYSVCDWHAAPPCPNGCGPGPESRPRAQLGFRTGRR